MAKKEKKVRKRFADRHDKLIGKMAELHINQQELSERINLSYQSLCNKLNGWACFSSPEIASISKELKIQDSEVYEYFFKPLLRYLNKSA